MFIKIEVMVTTFITALLIVVTISDKDNLIFVMIPALMYFCYYAGGRQLLQLPRRKKGRK